MITGPLTRLENTIKQASEFVEFRSPKGEDHKVIHTHVIGRKRDGREEESRTETEETRPFIVISPDYQNGVTANRIASKDQFVANGVMSAYMEKDVSDIVENPETTTDEDALWKWAEALEKFVLSIIDASRNQDGSTLRIESVTIQKFDRSTDGERNSIGDFFGADVRFTWGTQA